VRREEECVGSEATQSRERGKAKKGMRHKGVEARSDSIPRTREGMRKKGVPPTLKLRWTKEGSSRVPEFQSFKVEELPVEE